MDASAIQGSAPNSPEVQNFASQLSLLLSGSHILPIQTLDSIVAPWLRWEEAFRQLCLEISAMGGNVTLKQPFYGLLDVFQAPRILRKTPSPASHPPDGHGQNLYRPGQLATVDELLDFQVSWGIFTGGGFSSFTDWNNMVVAGPAVNACLAPLPQSAKASLQARREWITNMHDITDIHVFFYGLSIDEIKSKVDSLVAAIRTTTGHEPVVQLTQDICLVSLPEPYRKVQIVLKRFCTPAHVLADFDVDASCCIYDGRTVWLNARSALAIMHEDNLANLGDGSPLFKARAMEEDRPLHPPEVENFVSQLGGLLSGTHPVQTLDELLTPWLRWEAYFRQFCLRVSSIGGTIKLAQPFYGLIDVFKLPELLRTIPPSRLHNPHGYPVMLHVGRTKVLPNQRKPGDLATVEDMNEFMINWGVFTHNCLSTFTEWDNVVVAGGAPEACLAAPPRWAKYSLEKRQQWFNKAHEESDIDVFFYGISTREMDTKIASLVAAVREATGQEPELQRTVHTYSIKLEAPYRKIQFVLRKFATPADILVDFDVDAPCCLFNGTRVWSSPRSIIAFLRQANIVNYERHSPIYELRLAKYHLRGYECYFPGFDWEKDKRQWINELGYYIGKKTEVVYDHFHGVRLLLTIDAQLEKCTCLGEKRSLVRRYCRAAAGDHAYSYLGLGQEMDED